MQTITTNAFEDYPDRQRDGVNCEVHVLLRVELCCVVPVLALDADDACETVREMVNTGRIPSGYLRTRDLQGGLGEWYEHDFEQHVHAESADPLIDPAGGE